MWTVALSTAVAKLLGTVLAKRLRWFLYCLWCGGPEPPTGGLAPGELATDLAEELLETKVAAERRASFGTDASPLQDVLGKDLKIGHRGHRDPGKASRGAGGVTVTWVGREPGPGGAATRVLEGARGG